MSFREDQYYIDEVLDGRTDAFRPLVERHQDLVYTIVRRIIASAEEAEEVAQDVFVKAYRKLGEYRGNAKFSTWLYRIAYNTAISHTRKKIVTFLPADERGLEHIPDDSMQDDILGLSAEERGRLVNSALALLPATDRLIITLYYYHEKEVSEISGIIGMSESNVKVKLHRIRKRLLKEMNDIIGYKIDTVA
jgi:RNA polymerase sigma-70 factor (ECF subfamily)